ncbi:iron chelate uptake ABC transporter family permease subunit [Citricoccus sp.]|uniref:FecCD family ABC transporter permease n=1 Tax=Citricoccus sp. TaxID=1978372 RepID=UPI00261384C2|nr:iron ABC transporter permease [Citricoccus sp.]HRO28829.1 iron ABC transporter permease [Citricoccus sp.]HRO92327.1 iron ABC transporter permease [Citricoccus sp.]
MSAPTGEATRAAAGRPGSSAAPDALAAVRALQSGSRRRLVTVTLALAVALVLGMGVRVLLGGYTVTIPDFLAILGGETIPGASFIVLQEKLPRAVAGALAGAGFGAAGALFRRTLRNPLASPDILGVTQGAAVAAVGMLAFGPGSGSGAGMAVAALVGGLAATAVVLGFSTAGRSGGRLGGGTSAGSGGLAGALGGTTFIVAGIAVATLCQAVLSGVMLSLNQHDLQSAAIWTAGSLNAVTWERIVVLAVLLVVLLPAGGMLHARLAPADLGGELAHGLGSRPGRTGLGALTVGALLAAAATAATGPLAFVALLSTPVARGLTGGRPSLPAAALCGAVIVVAADFLAAEAFGGARLPTGVLTGAAGAPLMLWLLVRSGRRS